ncbi:MAG: hypothetical protein QOK38_2495 [Acidobacteriaceae bacterium]|nr:hypothetical protein [Acidobacteriaceae bacterium]
MSMLPGRHLLLLAALTPLILAPEPANLHAQTAKVDVQSAPRREAPPRTRRKRRR